MMKDDVECLSEEILVFSLMASDYTLWYLQEKLKATKGIIRSRSRKLKQKTIQWPKGQTMIYKTLHRILNIEQHKHN
jgi:hypothetical protein